MSLTMLLAMVAVLAGARVPGLSAQEFDVDRQATNLVRFVSQTTIQEFEGTTDRIDGYVVLGSTPLGPRSPDGSQLYFEVDLASLDTGVGLRNRDMRDDYLEVAKYPYAEYRGHLVSVDSAAGGGFHLVADGTMSIHGVKKDLRVPCDVVVAGAGYRATCSFQVLLSQYGIAIPRLMFLKVADRITLHLDFTVAPVRAGRGERP